MIKILMEWNNCSIRPDWFYSIMNDDSVWFTFRWFWLTLHLKKADSLTEFFRIS